MTTSLQLLSALSLDCERRVSILERELDFFLGALDHRVPATSNHAHFDSQKGPISHLQWTASTLAKEVSLVKRGAEFVLRCVSDARKTSGSTRVNLDKCELHLWLVVNALGAHLSSLARQMGALHGRYEQISKYSIPDHPSTAIYGLRDSTLIDRYLAEMARQIFRDLVRFVSRDDTLAVQYPFDTVPRVFVTRVYDPDARVQRFRTSGLHTDWVNWYQPGESIGLDETRSEGIRTLQHAPESFVSVEMPFWLPDSLESVPVIAHELAHVVIHDTIGSISAGNWGGEARDGLENLLRRIAQVVERTVFDAKEPTARAWALEIVCDLLAFARFRHAYLFSAATQALTSGQIRGFDLDTFEESRIAPILEHLRRQCDEGADDRSHVEPLNALMNMGVAGAFRSNQSADPRPTLLLMARLQLLARLSGSLAGTNHGDAMHLARGVEAAVTLLRQNLFADQQVVGYDELVGALFAEVTVAVPEKGRTYWEALGNYWAGATGETNTAPSRLDSSKAAEVSSKSTRLDERIANAVSKGLAQFLNVEEGQPSPASTAVDGGQHGLWDSPRIAALRTVPGADYFLWRQRISSTLVPRLNGALRLSSVDERHYVGEQVQDVVWRERWREANGVEVVPTNPRSLVLRPHIRRLVDDYLFRTIHPAPMFDLLSKRLSTAAHPEPTFSECYKTSDMPQHSNAVGQMPHLAGVLLPATEISDYLHTGRSPNLAANENFPRWDRGRILGSINESNFSDRIGEFPTEAWVMSFYLSPSGTVDASSVLPDCAAAGSMPRVTKPSAAVLLGRYDIVSMMHTEASEDFSTQPSGPKLIHKRCVIPLGGACADLADALALTMVALASPLAWRVFAIWFKGHTAHLAESGVTAGLFLSDGWEQVVVVYRVPRSDDSIAGETRMNGAIDAICESLECISDHPLVGRTETMFTKRLFSCSMPSRYDISVRFRCRAQAGTALRAAELQLAIQESSLPESFTVRVRTVSGLTDYEIRLFEKNRNGRVAPSPSYLDAAKQVHSSINMQSDRVSRLISQVAFIRRPTTAAASLEPLEDDFRFPPTTDHLLLTR